jgi:hypothetical protein
VSNFDHLATVINDEWKRIYGGEPVTDMFALEMRVKNIGLDRDSWAFNAKVLQKALNELEKK